MAENVPAGSTILDMDAWKSDCGSHQAHATVCHSAHEWARDAAADSPGEVHGRAYLHGFRGVHKRSLQLSVATYEAMVHAKRVTPELIRRKCIVDLLMHTGYT